MISKIDTGLNSTMLSQPNQNEMLEYLLKQIQQKSAAFAKANISYITLMTKDFFIYSIIKAYSEFKNSPDYIANAIVSSHDPKLQVALIMCALHNSEVMKVVKAHKQALLLRFKNSIPAHNEPFLNPRLVSDQTSVIIQEASTNLNN